MDFVVDGFQSLCGLRGPDYPLCFLEVNEPNYTKYAQDISTRLNKQNYTQFRNRPKTAKKRKCSDSMV